MSFEQTYNRFRAELAIIKFNIRCAFLTSRAGFVVLSILDCVVGIIRYLQAIDQFKRAARQRKKGDSKR